MARVAIPVTEIDRYLVVEPSVTAGSSANGHYFENDGDVVLEVTNTSGGNVTLTAEVNPDALVRGLSNVAVVIPAGQTWWVGPFAPALFTQPPIVLGTIFIEDGLHTGSSAVVPTAGTANCVLIDLSSSSVNLRAYRL